MDRLAGGLRSALVRTRPGVLFGAALAIAAGAVGLFVLVSAAAGSQVAPSGATVPPAWAGSVATLSLDGVQDLDADGLADSLENLVYGTDPQRMDTGGSGIPDGWLVRYGFDPREPGIEARPTAKPPAKALPEAYGNQWPARFVPSLQQAYAHGRPADWNESARGPYESGLDPTAWDAGADGIPDGWLLFYGLDPRDPGLASKTLAPAGGLSVREAFEHNTDPRKADTDLDGLDDRVEVDGPLDPKRSGARFKPTDPSRADTAGTGVCDGYLVAFGLDPLQPASANSDMDGDGATTRQEHDWSRERHGPEACKGKGVDPTRLRSGPSAIPDGWLLRHGLDPMRDGIDTNRTQEAASDPGPAGGAALTDGLANLALTVLDEYRVNRPSDWDEARRGPWWGGTDPTKADTDGDGLGDAWELRGLRVRVSTEPGTPAGPYLTSSDPTRQDTDRDGLPDAQEVDVAGRGPAAGGATDPRRWDTDFDGLDDGREVELGLGLDPARADTIGDLLPDGRRLQMLQQRSQGYARDPAYDYPGEPGRPRDVSEWADLAPGAASLAKPVRGAALAGLLGPRGDLDADGAVNVLDQDIEGDGLLNGWEVDPARYASSPHGLGEFAWGRPATDPLNPDTDGDGLRDAWEVEHGRPDYRVGRYSLDPSRWNSDAETESGEGLLSDGDEDGDDDGVSWVSFETGAPVAEAKNFTNLDEQQYRTDPNRFDSDEDGLADGWKVFWGLEYPARFPAEVPADAVRPAVGENQSAVVYQRAAYRRWTLDPDALLQDGGLGTVEARRTPVAVRDATGTAQERLVYPVDGQVALRFVHAQAARTNPYAADTDHDALPDWWELLHGAPSEGLAGDGECAATGLSPVLPQAEGDPDDDGLVNRVELAAGTDPLCPDSDAGGIRDAEEDGFGLDPTDPRDDATLLDDGTDTDADGVPDFEEITGIRSIDYRSYLGPLPVRTRHDHPDTDGDGLLDGRSVPDARFEPNGWPAADARTRRFLDLGVAYLRTPSGGFSFLGERAFSTDPRDGDDAGIGVPSGWLAAHSVPICTDNVPGCTPTDPAVAEAYRIGMPRWWTTAEHGPWWGGARPNDDLDALQANLDLDRDGLLDRDGDAGYEDPLPAANVANALRPVDYAGHGLSVPAHPSPTDAALEPLARRMVAQAVLSPRVLTNTAYERDRDAGETTARTQPCLQLDPLPGPLVLLKGSAKQLTGRVLSGCGSGANGIPGLTVEARMGSPAQVFGVNFTGLDGRFTLHVNLTELHEAAVPANAILRGNTSGIVRWSADAGAIPVGDGRFLTVRSYATPAGPAYAARVPPLLAGFPSEPIFARVEATTKVALTAPRVAPTGQDVLVGVRLSDSGGSPMAGRILVGWEGMPPLERMTGLDGTVDVPVEAPHALAGNRTLVVRAPPPNAFTTEGLATATVELQRPLAASFASLPGTVDSGRSLQARGRVTVPSGGTASLAGVQTYLDLALEGGAPISVSASLDGEGAARFTVPVPADAAPGPYVATFRVPATPASQATQAQALVVVRSQPRLVGVSAEDIALGSPAKVSGRLLEPDGAPVPGVTVTVELAGAVREAMTGPEGEFEARFTQPLPHRPVLQRIQFDGDLRHQPVAHRSERMVLSTTVLEVTGGSAVRNQTAAVVLRLTDAQGTPLALAPVHLRWANEPATLALTDANGSAVIRRAVPVAEALGPTTVRGHYNGSAPSGFAPSSSSATWLVRSAVRLDLPAGLHVLTGPVAPGLLRDAGTGQPLADQVVSVRANFTGAQDLGLVREARTDHRGMFPLLPSDLRLPGPGRLVFDVAFAGDAVHGPARATTTLDARTPTNLTLRLPLSLVAGREAAAVARAVDVLGAPAQGGLVQLWMQGTQIGAWPVHDGTARMNFTLPESVATGPVAVEARFLGDPMRLPAAATGTVQVLAPVRLLLRAETDAPGGAALVRVEALSGGKPLPYTTVSLAVGGTGTGLVAKTDKDGVAEFRLERDWEEVPVAARFAGDGTLGPAMAYMTLQGTTVPEPLSRGGLPLAWIAASAAAVLAALAGAALRLRRQPLDDAFRRIHHLVDRHGLTAQAVLAAFRILEDTAIGHALLRRPARTAADLTEALQPHLPVQVRPRLASFIHIFEEARYGPQQVAPAARQRALEDLRSILAGLERAHQPAGGPA